MRVFFILLLIFVGLPTIGSARAVPDSLKAGGAVHFVENLGQWDGAYRYEAQLHDAALFVAPEALTVVLRTPLSHPAPNDALPRCHAYRMHFTGASAVSPQGDHATEYYSNYILGDDASRWRSHVPSYMSVRYRDLYKNVDLEIYGSGNGVKYNFIVAPGGDPGQIGVYYEGADKVTLGRDGSVVVHTTVRSIRERRPYVFQLVDGEEREVASRWFFDGDTLRLALGAYDKTLPLVVDPLLIFSTYTGSTADNWGTTAAYDSYKNAYTAGLVFAIGYPTSLGAYQQTPGGGVDIGIFKFDTLGQQRLYATYLGGSGSDMPHSLFVNHFDQLLIMGTTGSSNFPTTSGAYQRSHAGGNSINYESTTIGYPNGSDLFVARLSPDGTTLQASTYIGGSGNDGLNFRNHYNDDYQVLMGGNDSLYYNYGDGARGELITDNLGNIYVGSTTFSADFPVTTGCVQPAAGGGQDGVVFKLDHNLRTLLWSTYLGGSGDDAVYSIDVDSSYNLLVCGGTASSDFPTIGGAFQHSYGGGTADGFVAKLSYGGNRLLASSFFGGSAYDQLYFVRAGRHDEVFLFGQTLSGAAMVHGAPYCVYNSGMLLARLTPDLTQRVWSTTFGTPGRVNLSPTAFAADICNRIYAVGWGRDFVGYGGVRWNTLGTTGMETTANAYSDTTDGQDFYILSIDRDATDLSYASFFGELHNNNSSRGGGDHVDGGTSRFDRLATLYQSVCASCGGYNGFPVTADAWSDSNRSSNCNNALFRFNVADDFPVAEFTPPPAGCEPYTVAFHNTGRGSTFLWDFGDGTYSTQRHPTHTYSAAGLYTITLIASQDGGCSEADTMRHTLHVLGTSATFTPRSSCGGEALQIGPLPQMGATYQWLSEGVSDPTIANPWVDSTGTYLLRISAEGCSEVDTFVVRTYRLYDSLSVTPVSCPGRSDGELTVWLDGSLVADSIATTISPAVDTTMTGGVVRYHHLAADTDYVVTLTGYGCSVDVPLRLTSPLPAPYEKEVSRPLCDDSCTAWLRITYNLSNATPTDTLVGALCEGVHHTHFVNEGCPQVDTTYIRRSHLVDSLHVWADRTLVVLGEGVRLHAEVVPAADGISYQWRPVSLVDNPTSPSPMATPEDSVQWFVVTAQSADGCQSRDSLVVATRRIVCGEPDFFIPNAFTPNGDGLNDWLDLRSDVLSELDFRLYNRWGQCVFSCTDPTTCRWDGHYQGALCLPGVYTYTATLRCVDGSENHLKGDITIIR